MSGWLAKKGVWPTVVPEGTYALLVGEKTKVSIHVVHKKETTPNERGPIHIVSPTTTHNSALVLADVAMEVVPPAAAYTHPSQEPNDNTLRARSTRFAHVRLLEARSLGLPQLWMLTYVFFTLWPDQEYFALQGENSREEQVWLVPLLLSGLGIPYPAENHTRFSPSVVLVSRAAFWQGAGPLSAGSWAPVLCKSLEYIQASGDHTVSQSPLSNCPATFPSLGLGALQFLDGPLYRRYIPELQQTLTLRLARSSSDFDVDLVYRWHASERVNTGWRQNMPRDEHRKYLEAQEASPNGAALIGEWDDEPFGYLEVYDAKPSNLREFYNADDFDRGFHALVGEERFRGPHRVRSWMGAVIHLLFLLDPRTMRVVSEPRASNTKMVDYECMCGGHVEKLIDLSHKRAALVLIPRERFFQVCPMGPLPSQ